MAAVPCKGCRGKSGLHKTTVPGNARPGKPEGKRHRKQTAPERSVVKVKRWGKSPPRDGQPDRHGKPHREQCRIGTSRPARAGPPWPGGPGWQLERFGNGSPRGMIVGTGATRRHRIRLTGRPRISTFSAIKRRGLTPAQDVHRPGCAGTPRWPPLPRVGRGVIPAAYCRTAPVKTV